MQPQLQWRPVQLQRPGLPLKPVASPQMRHPWAALTHAEIMTTKELLHDVTSLIQRSMSDQLNVPEDTGTLSLEEDLVAKVLELVEMTTALLERVMERYEGKSSAESGEEGADAVKIEVDDDTDFLKEIGARISAELACREVADVAFFGRNQVLESLDALQRALDQRSIWKIASHADTAQRRAGKALIAVESAIREYEGLPARERHWEEIEDTIEIRRLYGQFRRTVLRGGEPEDLPALRTHLRQMARRIAILRDLKIYPFLRIDDRLQIRSLQKRIQGWLDSDELDEESGRRLWNDLVSFSRLLMQINNRETLREHDRRLVNKVCYQLFLNPSAPATIPAETLLALETLLGRDDDLDHLLLQPTPAQPQAWRAPLLRLQRELSQSFSDSSGISTLHSVSS